MSAPVPPLVTVARMGTAMRAQDDTTAAKDRTLKILALGLVWGVGVLALLVGS